MLKFPFRMCAFDLETTSLSADLGVILCAVLKEPRQRPTILRIDETSADWAAQPEDDQRLVDELARRLETYDVWLAFNGLGFDLPFLRSRLAHWGLKPLATRILVDPYLIARRKFRLSSDSLATLAAYLDLGRKVRVPPGVWMRAALQGDRAALNQIVRHCKRDVLLLERLIPHLKAYCTQLNSWGSS
jgi:uncharacterized protein YprB with RNaseH-like and TPR domain